MGDTLSAMRDVQYHGGCRVPLGDVMIMYVRTLFSAFTFLMKSPYGMNVHQCNQDIPHGSEYPSYYSTNPPRS